MADKKKDKFENIAEEHPLTVECPHHGQVLQTETENKATDSGGTVFVRFAICRCKLPAGEANPYYGQRVWERT